MQRIYTVIEWEAELEAGKFLLFLNITDRTDETTLANETLIYGGVTALRGFLEESKNPELDAHWKALNTGEISPEKSKEGERLYDQFRRGQLGLNDLSVGHLKDYFRNYLEKGQFDNDLQEQEYPILNYHFSIEEAHFLSLPLILFGRLDGILHIIFSQDLKNKLGNKGVWKSLIKRLSEEYEGLLLTWDLIGADLNKAIEEALDYFFNPDSAEPSDSMNNRFFTELGFETYYHNSRNYFQTRLKNNYAIPDYIKNEHRKRAIISILIDSYAHNFSANSLSVLKWWFQQRAIKMDLTEKIAELEKEISFRDWGQNLVDFLVEKFPGVYTRDEITFGLKYDLARWHSIFEKIDRNDDFRAVRDQFFSLETELSPLFKFLLEKGAFWSGVTRDQQFGGEIHNLYRVLWDDFIQNPLYLGTIAYSEGITKLNICIRIYSDEKYTGKKDTFHRTYKLKQNESGKVLDGVLATIDVGGAPFHSFRHRFVHKGILHEELKAALEACEVFFPGGVVGKHAFFTLLENEIRNVKHFPVEDRNVMKKNGLNLVIAIRPGSLSSRLGYEVEALYKIGVWLGHRTRFEGQKDHLAMLRFNRLLDDIITPGTNEARLGGTYQDKICSAMLFNNTFISVERQKTKRDKVYYPWVRAAFGAGPVEGDLKEIDYEINNQNYLEWPERLKEAGLPSEGYFKKYVHLWRGDFIFHAENSKNMEVENVNRFRIVNLTASDDELRKNLLKAGVIRILEKQAWDIQPSEAYHRWLTKWIWEDYFAVKLLQGHTEVGYIFFDETRAQYFSKKEYFQLDAAQQDEYGEYPESSLKFAHHSANIDQNQPDVLSIRSNGVLRENFFQNVQSIEDFAKGEITDLALYELIEVLKTRLCIFDKRIADRAKSNKTDLLAKQLGCEIYGETMEEWESVMKNGVTRYNFIVVHLSFIEGMKRKTKSTAATPDQPGQKSREQLYGEEGIVDFVKDYLGTHLSDNCILVITTGRGRNEWWRKLETSEYATHTTFRPVESLIEAVEKPVLKNDDIELKYNLIKVLFGS